MNITLFLAFTALEPPPVVPWDSNLRVTGSGKMLVADVDVFSTVTILSIWLASIVIVFATVQKLWVLRWNAGRDNDIDLPLPKGSMGLPVVGETFHWFVQGADFHSSRRERFGNVFKTHLLGRPVVRVTGGENVRRILMGEHQLVLSQWPQSTRRLLGGSTLVNSVGDIHRFKRKVMTPVLSHSALESYLPSIQHVVRDAVSTWSASLTPTTVYPACKHLTFRIAMRVLLGFRPSEAELENLSNVFEQFVENLFSLPFDLPFSGLRKGINARNKLHLFLEKFILEKLEKSETKDYLDALDILISSANQHDKSMSMLELKEAVVELIFAAYSTTASASTSLILQLLKHPAVLTKLQEELVDAGLSPPPTDGPEYQGLSLSSIMGLNYLDWVIKEVLRLLPPVSGGYRIALKTFELDGCQIPKGWGVMYSIRDTQDMAAAFSSPQIFDPERFSPARQEDAKERFSYLPFGGGVRSCLGKELAKVIIKVLAIELASSCSWELASQSFPQMHAVPIVHPVDGLLVCFRPLAPEDRATEARA